MTTTVYFATNRIANHPADRPENYTFSMVAPDNPLQVTYGTAFVDSAGLTADTVGAIRSIHDLQKGGFSQTAFDDLAEGGRNILVFIHGFSNSFENALTRAAFNREWLAASGVSEADTTVVTFSWPSRGQLLTIPFPTLPYRSDQKMAGGSGLPLMRFFANLLPILETARANGRRTFLLTHSMGNLALQAAVQAWFDNGNGDAEMFDHIKAYRGQSLLFTFHDAFDGWLLVSEHLPDDAIARFCQALGVSRRREETKRRDPEQLRRILWAFENPHKVRIAGESWWRRLWRQWKAR